MLRDSHKGKKELHKETCLSLEDQYNKLENRIEKMYEDHLDGKINEDFFKRKHGEYRREQTNIQTRLNKLKGADEDYYITATYLLKLANKASKIFESSELETKRQLIKLVLQNPVVNDTTLTATIRKPFNLIVKGPSRSKWLPIVASRANFSYQFEFQKVKRISKRKLARQKRQESYVNPIKQALKYQRMILEEKLNQSQLANKLGISRVRVNQYLALLKLPKDHQQYILEYGKEQMITERSIRQNSLVNY